MFIFLCLALVFGTSTSLLSENYEKYAGKPDYLLVLPTPVRYVYKRKINLYKGEFDVKPVFGLTSNTKVKLLRKSQKRSYILLTAPFYFKGWVDSVSLVKIAVKNSLFYQSSALKHPIGLIVKGTYLKVIGKYGKALKVKLHNQTALVVYIKKNSVGTSLSDKQGDSYSYYVNWQRRVYACSPGPLYNNSRKKKIAGLYKKSMMKIIRKKKGWLEIAPANYYYVKTKFWVPANRISKKSYYYYNYSYNFHAYSIKDEKYYEGGIKLKKRISGYISKNATEPILVLNPDVKIYYIHPEGEGLFKILFYNNKYYKKFGFIDVLNMFDNSNLSLAETSELLSSELYTSIIYFSKNFRLFYYKTFFSRFFTYKPTNTISVYARLKLSDIVF